MHIWTYNGRSELFPGFYVVADVWLGIGACIGTHGREELYADISFFNRVIGLSYH